MRTRSVLVIACAAAPAVAFILSGCGINRPVGAAPPPTSVSNQRQLRPTGVGTGRAVLTAGTTGNGAGTITTIGTGTVSGAPDTMTVSVSVSNTAPHAVAALAQNSAVAAAVQRALQAEGVAASDIQTSGLSLQRTYPPSPAGYQVDDSVIATIHNMTGAGSVIDDAVAAAGDTGRLDGVSFSISATNPLMSEARAQAVQAARTQAQQLAAAAGERLGMLVSLSEQPQQTYPTGVQFGASASSAAAPVPIKPGTQQLNETVNAVWSVTL